MVVRRIKMRSAANYIIPSLSPGEAFALAVRP